MRYPSIFINSARAQSLPENGKVIQRVIVDQNDPLPAENPEKSSSSNVAAYALGLIVFVILITAIWIVWKKHRGHL